MMMMFRGWTCGPVSSLRLVNGIFVDHVEEKKSLYHILHLFSAGTRRGKKLRKDHKKR